jgi:hypothetical protein
MSRALAIAYLLTSTLFVCMMAVVNLAHPLMHHLEGGTIDSVIDYMTALAAQTSATTRRT